MTWKKIANLRGPAGYNATGAAEDDAAIAAFARATAGPTALNRALTELTGLNPKNFGAVGDGVHDDTVALQAAIDAAVPGQAVIFSPSGSTNEFYRITSGLLISEPGIRLIGQPRDAYSVSIRCATPGVTMLTVKHAGFVAQDIHFMGVDDIADGGTNGAGMTVNGLDLYGTIRGDIDAEISGCTFQYMNVAIRTRARNAKVSDLSLFNHCRRGVVIDGIDPTYHTDPAAVDQNRGNTIDGCRFHNVGASSADAAVDITNTAKVLHAIIKDNFFDSFSENHVRAVGTAAAPHTGLTLSGNKHTETIGNAYDLTFVQDSTLKNADVMGPIAGRYTGDMVRLTDCTNISVGNVFGRRIGKSVFVGTRCTGIKIDKLEAKGISSDPGFLADCIVFDAASSQITMRGGDFESSRGGGFTGDPTLTTMVDYEFRGMGAKNINSKTVVNHTHRGANASVEGKDGRIEEIGYGQYELAAGVAKEIAVVTSGGNFGSFLLEVELTGRSSAGDAYLVARRAIRPENGTPVSVTLGTDAAAGVTLGAITASGTAGVSVKVTATQNNWVGVRVRASAGGAASAANNRSVTVAMAAQS